MKGKLMKSRRTLRIQQTAAEIHQEVAELLKRPVTVILVTEDLTDRQRLAVEDMLHNCEDTSDEDMREIMLEFGLSESQADRELARRPAIFRHMTDDPTSPLYFP